MRVENEADRLRVRVGEEHSFRKRAAALAVPIPLRVSHLMAVDAALHHAAAIVQLRAVLACEHRVLLRRLELRLRPTLSRQVRLVRRIPLVQGKRPLQRSCKPFHGDVVGPERAVGPGAEPPVDRAVRVEQEHGERLIGIELEGGQVQPVRRDDTHADKLVEQRAHARVLIDKIVVQLDALHARDAAEHDQHRLAAPARLHIALRQIVIDPQLIRLDLLAVVAHLLFPSLSLKTHSGREEQPDRAGKQG